MPKERCWRVWTSDITDEQDQRFHASADRLADLQEALRIICLK